MPIKAEYLIDLISTEVFGLCRRQGHWTDAIDRSAKGCKDRYSFGGRIEFGLCMLKMIIALCYYFASRTLIGINAGVSKEFKICIYIGFKWHMSNSERPTALSLRNVTTTSDES